MVSVVGIGYDSHRFALNRKLIIGGVEIPFDKGLDGHSDADVLCHAIIDAILGACGKPDIGKIFPDTDPKWKNACSIEMLKHVVEMIKKDAELVYIDAIVITEKPKIAKFSDEIKSNIAKAINCSQERINIKAKTNEKMGFIGREEGIAVIVTATINRTFAGK